MQTVYTTTTGQVVNSGAAKSRKKSIRGTAVGVTFFGLLMLILDAVAISTLENQFNTSTFSTMYSGIWSGLIYMIAGAVGIYAGTKHAAEGAMTIAVITSVIAAIQGFVAIIIQGLAASYCAVQFLNILTNCTSLLYTLHSAITAIATVNWIVCIVLSGMECGGCCGQQNTSSNVTIASVPVTSTAYGNPYNTQYTTTPAPLPPTIYQQQPQYTTTAAPSPPVYAY